MNNGLKLAGQFLVEKLQEELREQGHHATGELINSINYRIEGDVLIIQTPKAYASAMENGLPKGHAVPIGALIRWIEVKGIATGDKEIRSAAWAIRAAIIREGSPTTGEYGAPSAFAYTKNGRRTGFVEVVINEHAKKALILIEKELGKEIQAIISNEVKKINNGDNG